MKRLPGQSPEALAARDALRAYLRAQEAAPDLYDRAVVLEELVQEFYDHTKFRAPGGAGLDGRDGPERHAVGAVRDAARAWREELRAQRRAERATRN
ncbi:hypothetical protein [Litorihabitans aurantiacus]|uniref:Uncharacterized protein n=1 Tax=Litorihabitans aurantiacus TaxID=1930061 RepID=A0AA37XIC5_9MICO|nr:hypothetical protein [Litorihabitans aurantiacus]GMA33674.1 hypothetical protein GCM10025875_36660 [Litorihabitans aurantiacus]GMA33743.1 hypothetical protein GCM10025875_37350 [Litorihabitans aurantiacus]